MKESDRNEVKRGEWITYKQFYLFSQLRVSNRVYYINEFLNH